MSEEASTETESESGESVSKLPLIVYILYLASFFVGITVIIGVVLAYIDRSRAPEWMQTHYQYQIRTFWIGLLMGIVGFLTLVFWVGFIILFLMSCWFAIRCVKGMMRVSNQEPIANPETWLV